MERTLLITLVSIFFLSIASASLCQEQTDIDDVPCIGLTKVVSCTGNTNVTVVNLNNTLKYNLTTTSLGDGTYNFTFNFSKSSYSLIACDNSTATIVVGDFEGDKLWKLSIVLAIVGAAFIYVSIGKFILDKEQNTLKVSLFISAILTFIIAIQMSILTSYNTNIIKIMAVSSTLTIALVLFIFLYLFIYYLVNVIRALKNVKKDKEDNL